MDITYLGHSSFKLRGRTATVIADPFDPKFVGLKFASNEAEIVTISHNHEDHNNSEAVKGTKMVVNGPGEYEISGISIIGIPSFHDAKKGEERGKNVIYVFEMDGLRIVHLGDLGCDLTDSEISQIGSVDVLLIPVGGEYTIGAKDAVKIISAIDPYFVIPMHYKVDGLSSELASKLEPVETFLSECGLNVERMDKFSLKREDILEDQSAKAIVLERK